MSYECKALNKGSEIEIMSPISMNMGYKAQKYGIITGTDSLQFKLIEMGSCSPNEFENEWSVKFSHKCDQGFNLMFFPF